MTLYPTTRSAPVLLPLVFALGLALGANAWAADPAADHGPAHAAPATAKPTKAPTAPEKTSTPDAHESPIAKKTVPVDGLPAASGNPMAEKIRAAMAGTVVASKKMTVTVEGKDGAEAKAAPAAAHSDTVSHSISPTAKALASQRYSQARAAAVSGHATGKAPAAAHAAPGGAHGGEAHWAYEGETGPQSWGNLKPEFNVCAIGKRQSPINIEQGSTLQGPAEPVEFAYAPSNASVVNNGHTIQVDVQGDNSITARGSNYRLLQFHFHTPSEEQINYKRFPMVAHLVHKNNEGQLAVVAVLLQEGESNALIDKVWTYMPLDSGDRVRMPQGLLDVNELLPKDQRYYQFMGSLTTPPCTEGVLWMILKQPVTLSKAQYKLFTQLYPNNARPVQAVNGRPVREAQ
ncbi:MAG TPA: carbonic anhydrase family protein [Rhodoferax sp.]|jgi:carbonic anhydrase|nr:carbonic anhydrase family protein [Rhodoferax sp.]HNV60927.1 carbonic anhydrase family protein [Rhodoferax sp.]